MTQQNESPFACHVFVCVNDRGGARKSCADGDNVAVREALKQAVADRGWRSQVRVSQSGCLGLCEAGPNVMLYPQKVWFSAVTLDDVPTILDKIGHALDQVGG